MADSTPATFDQADAALVLTPSRRALHAIAELVLAGPQYRQSGTIRLRVVDDGISTIALPDLAIRVGDGILRLAGTRIPVQAAEGVSLVTTTCAALAAAAGIEPGAPEGLYHDGSGVNPTDELAFNPAAVSFLLEQLRTGDAALRAFAPAETPVLWPEHFDVGIAIDDINYGVSLGDGYLELPYAYVVPCKPLTGEFWNAPFGAARPLAALAGAAGVAGVVEFFAEGQRLSQQSASDG
jgi:hypothetical protein